MWCRLSILTDEVSQDLDAVLAFAREFQLDGIELRSLWGEAFRDLTPAQLRTVRSRCDAAGLAVSGCATPVFKCDLDAPQEIAEHRELFRRAVEAAHLLGCELVRVFTFLRRAHPTTADDLERAATHFAPLLDLAREANVVLGVENEASCLVGTGTEACDFLRHLPASPHLGVVWDPCNVLFLEGTNLPFPDEYAAVAERVLHVHIKDAHRSGTAPAQECVELGRGEIDFPGQLAALRTHGYRGWVTLETHWRAERLTVEAQHLPAGHAFSAGAEAASRLCMAQLQTWLRA